MTAVLATEAWQIISHTDNTVEDHLRARNVTIPRISLSCVSNFNSVIFNTMRQTLVPLSPRVVSVHLPVDLAVRPCSSQFGENPYGRVSAQASNHRALTLLPSVCSPPLCCSVANRTTQMVSSVLPPDHPPTNPTTHSVWPGWSSEGQQGRAGNLRCSATTPQHFFN